jgi:hypothetical protein
MDRSDHRLGEHPREYAAVTSVIESIDIAANRVSAAIASEVPGRVLSSSRATAPVPPSPCSAPIASDSTGGASVPVTPWRVLTQVSVAIARDVIMRRRAMPPTHHFQSTRAASRQMISPIAPSADASIQPWQQRVRCDQRYSDQKQNDRTADPPRGAEAHPVTDVAIVGDNDRGHCHQGDRDPTRDAGPSGVGDAANAQATTNTPMTRRMDGVVSGPAVRTLALHRSA